MTLREEAHDTIRIVLGILGVLGITLAVLGHCGDATLAAAEKAEADAQRVIATAQRQCDLRNAELQQALNLERDAHRNTRITMCKIVVPDAPCKL